MKIKDLIKYLQKLEKEGYGEFIVLSDGYMNEVTEENIEVNIKEKLIIV
ncbi:hypothetical protein LI064_01975 [Clostridium perfringens]|nr:hypothetical protein [Clostridium perfringens]MCX0353289.1 hypothetical protein [Clostridium perfringens]